MKRGQMKISFGMIFSIFLIVAFLAFAFYAINNFLKLQEGVQLKQFVEDFQDDVDRMWKGSQGSDTAIYPIPKNVENICIVRDDYYNLIFHASHPISEETIKHLDLDKSLGDEPFICFDQIDQKITITISKNYGEALVRVSN